MLTIQVERTVTFRDGPTVKETVDEYAQTAVSCFRAQSVPSTYPDATSQAYFEMETGTRVLNVLSYNESHELVLTFSFVNGIPGLKPGSSRPHGADLEQLVNKIGDGAVQATIDRIRELVRNGTIAV
jgi:hypothetical protein